MNVEHILETCLYVDDLPRAERFYITVLGLTFDGRQEGRHVFLRCGRRMLLLFNPLGSRESSDHIPPHGAFGPGHVAFAICEDELEAWTNWLNGQQVVI